MTDQEILVSMNDKTQWCRDHWKWLKEKAKLEEAISRILKGNRFLEGYTVQDIIDMEEAIDEAYGGKFLR